MNKRHLNENGDLIIRASQIGKIMAKGKVAGELSAGAKTYIQQLFRETYLDYYDELDGKEITKGITQESDGIELLNLHYDKKYVKNDLKASNGYVNGTCDILTKTYIRDVKLPWSKKTHPLFPEGAKNDLYEWQLRAYMMLFNRDKAYLDYCLVQTDPKLIPTWESQILHDVNDLPLNMRVTTLMFNRDLNLEAQMIKHVELARKEWNKLYNQIMK